MKELLEQLRVEFQNEDARYAYADSVTNAFISAQIKALREDRELSQEELAELIGTKQSGISRLEKADYSAWRIETLRKLARAFGLRLRISFEEFGTLLLDIKDFGKRLRPRKFEEDPVFKGQDPEKDTEADIETAPSEARQAVARLIPVKAQLMGIDPGLAERLRRSLVPLTASIADMIRDMEPNISRATQADALVAQQMSTASQAATTNLQTVVDDFQKTVTEFANLSELTMLTLSTLPSFPQFTRMVTPQQSGANSLPVGRRAKRPIRHKPAATQRGIRRHELLKRKVA